MISRQSADREDIFNEPVRAHLRIVSNSQSALSDFRRLHAFVVVAEELHFRRAADRLHMAQSPLSRTIRALESDLGFPLFDRNRRGVRLRPSGHAFLAEVREMLEHFESEIRRIRHIAARAAS